jgi:energy-coupling factor transporter ATP-binding protein EcfA2
MPQTDALTFDKLRDKLAWHGVVAAKKQMDAIMNYLIAFVKELQHKSQVEIMRTQFGWTEGNNEFILGEKEIGADGTTYSPPSSTTGSLANFLAPTGDYDEWKSIVKTYDQPQFEPHAFGFFTAFGAPLLKHLNLKGAIINLINNTSGTGKSTVLKMCNSVWGHPEELMLQWKDTQNAMIHRLGVMNNLPVTIDEITKMSGDHFSDLVYSISQGRGKNRMMQHSNEERHNATKWATIALCSSNASFYDKLSSLKSTPDGEFMRLIEYRIEVTDILSKEEADAIFTPLYSHYGHAGVQYAEYLVGNLEAAVDLVMQVQQKIDKAVGFTSRERFWSGAVACNIAGALIAKDLGIIDFDVKRVYDWIIKELAVMRTEIKAPAQTQSSVIGEFMNDHRKSTLVINGEVDARTGMGAIPILDVKYGELLIRIEPDTKLLWINSKHLKSYCVKQQITLKDTLKGLEADGIYKGQVKKRMSKGTDIQTPAVHAYMFSIDNNDFINAEDYIQAAKQDADTSAELQG